MEMEKSGISIYVNIKIRFPSYQSVYQNEMFLISN